MSGESNDVIETYSRLASEYDHKKNSESCWGLAARKAVDGIRLKDDYRTVVDVGCGTGEAITQLAEHSSTDVEFVGLEPAENMRKIAATRTAKQANVRIMDGRFEKIPLDSDSIDYLYSIMAFHWTTSLERSVSELARVLAPRGEMDLVFVGRNNGREFIKKTSPIFLRYLGPAQLLESVALRKQLSREEALDLFGDRFENSVVTADQTFDTYYDTLDGHWGWWVRIEGQFLKMPPERKVACDRDVKEALAELETPAGIPYTIHSLHVRVRSSAIFP